MRTKLFCLLCLLLAQPAESQERSQPRSFSEATHGTVSANLPSQLKIYLEKHILEFKLPSLNDFASDMLAWYYCKRNPQDHPAFCSGDFNFDGILDYALILTSWRGGAILVICNGTKDKTFDLFIIEEVKGYNDDYLIFAKKRLCKGNFEKDGTHIEWDNDKKTYRASGY